MEEVAGGRAMAAAVERPRRERGAVQQPPPALQTLRFAEITQSKHEQSIHKPDQEMLRCETIKVVA